MQSAIRVLKTTTTDCESRIFFLYLAMRPNGRVDALQFVAMKSALELLLCTRHSGTAIWQQASLCSSCNPAKAAVDPPHHSASCKLRSGIAESVSSYDGRIVTKDARRHVQLQKQNEMPSNFKCWSAPEPNWQSEGRDAIAYSFLTSLDCDPQVTAGA